MKESAPSDKELFADVLALPAAARADYLAEVCMGNDAQRARIEALLQASAEAGSLLEKPPVATITVATLPEEMPGERIGRYKLLQRIGEGGCGTVYMAEQDEPIRRRVALKVIKLGMDTKAVIARFEAERQALAMMDHPNIARVFDAGATAAGRPYFVMELVRGVRITDYCDENNLPTAERLKLFAQVCHAIQHAHQKGIIHRDIKPSNVLVAQIDGAAVPKVIDFGIAKATQGRLTDQTLFTAFEQLIGTPVYMSPEQAEATGNDVDTRADIYSLGVLLYELLTGRPPFDPKSLAQAGLGEIRRILREVEPSRPSTRLSTLSNADRATAAKLRHTDAPKLIHLLRGDLDWIVMRCLEKNRNRRYETANALANDVQRHLQQEPITARPPSKLYRAQRLVARNKLAFAAAAAVVLALVAGLGVSLWGFREAEASQRVTDRARGEAEKLMTFLLDDFYDEFAPTGQLGSVARLAKQAAEYYAGLPEELRSPVTERNRAFALARYGAALAQQGYSDRAKPLLWAATTALKQLRSEGDRSEPVLLNLMLARRHLAKNYSQSLWPVPALDLMKHAVAEMRPLATQPGVTRRLRQEYGELLTLLGYLQNNTNFTREDATVAPAEARQVFAGLGAKEFTDLRISSAYAEASLNAARAQRGQASEREKLAEEALAVADAVLERRPADLRALKTRAFLVATVFSANRRSPGWNLEAIQANHEERVKRWRELLRYDPSDATAWGNLCEAEMDLVDCLLAKGQVRAARAQLQAAGQNRHMFVSPALARIEGTWWDRAAEIAAMCGDRAEAERCLAEHRRAVELREQGMNPAVRGISGPAEEVSWVRRGVLELLGDHAAEYEDAKEALVRIEKKTPATDSEELGQALRRFIARRDLAFAALHLGRYAEAESNCRANINDERLPKIQLFMNHLYLAWALCRQGRAAEARADFEAAFARSAPTSDQVSASYNLRVRLIRGLWVKALVQPDDAAGAARRRELLDQAAAMLAAESAELRQVIYFRELQTWIDEARAELDRPKR